MVIPMKLVKNKGKGSVVHLNFLPVQSKIPRSTNLTAKGVSLRDDFIE